MPLWIADKNPVYIVLACLRNEHEKSTEDIVKENVGSVEDLNTFKQMMVPDGIGKNTGSSNKQWDKECKT